LSASGDRAAVQTRWGSSKDGNLLILLFIG
jgi:hypothetical protein